MTTTDIIIDQAAKELANEIDWNILADIFLESGWTEVRVLNHVDKYRQGMAKWVHANIKGHQTGYRDRWLFENAKDATWFRIRWA